MRKRNMKIAIFAVISLLFAVGMNGCLSELDAGPPIVTFINPANGALLDGVVPIVVTATDDKSLKNLHLLIDGVEIQKVDGGLLSYDWDTTPIADNRLHFLSAYAIDSEDNIGPSVITTVTLVDPSQLDTLPQVVAIQNPLNGQQVSGVVNIAVGINRQQNNPIDSVQVYIDGVKVTTDTEFPYIYPWDVNSLPNGSTHTIFAISFDRFGYNISSGVSNVTVNTLNYSLEAPQSSVINPLNAQSVRGIVNIASQVSNLVNGNAVDSVVFVVDGFRIGTDSDNSDNVFFNSWDTRGLANGSQHTIFAVVYDQQQFNISTNIIRVTVNSDVSTDGVAPTVTLVYPDPAGQIVFSVSQTSSVRIVADAFDNTRVDRVEFYIDGILQGTDTTPLYEYDWNFSGYETGVVHTVYLKAYDPSGNAGVTQIAVRLDP